MTIDQRLTAQRVKERLAVLHAEQPTATLGDLALPAVRHEVILDAAWRELTKENDGLPAA